MRIRNPRDFWAGAIYLALAIGRDLDRPQLLSSAPARGWEPGYFPTVLGSILALFGVVSVGPVVPHAG